MSGRDVVVVGGGIGGLASAVALHRRGWRVSVLERRAGFTEVGAGVSLWPNAMGALAALGLAQRVRGLGAVESAGGVRDRAGRWLTRVDNTEIARRHGRPLVVVRRADLVRVLVEALPPEVLRPGCALRSARPDGDGVLVEHTGGTLRADLVVGADGLRGELRQQWWPAARGPRYAGSTAWRMITEPVPGPPGEGAVYWGRGERVGFTALPGGRFYCFAAAAVPEGGASAGGEHAALLRRFGDWPDPIPGLLAATPPADVLRHDLYDLPPLPTYVHGRAVLLGDAAHPIDPVLGQGACLALEDAVTLADLLDRSPDVDAALAGYDRIRGPRTRAIARRARGLRAVAQVSAPPAALLRDLAARLTPAAATLRAMSPVLGWTAPTAEVECDA